MVVSHIMSVGLASAKYKNNSLSPANHYWQTANALSNSRSNVEQILDFKVFF